MSISERLNDGVFVERLQSLDKDIAKYLYQAVRRAGIEIEQDQIPIFRIDVNGEYPVEGPFAAENVVTVDGQSTLYISPSLLADHAENVRGLLGIIPDDERQEMKLEVYCLMQSMVDLTLQAIPGLTEDDRDKVIKAFTEKNFLGK